MARSLVFSSFFWNYYFSLCDLNMFQAFSSTSSSWLVRRERERERDGDRHTERDQSSKQQIQWANICMNTGCLGELGLFGWDNTKPPLLIWALGYTSLEAEIQEKERRKVQGVGQEREAWEMRHILPWWQEVISLSGKWFIFQGLTPCVCLGVKLA